MDYEDENSDDEHLRLQLMVIRNLIGSAMRSQALVILLSEPGPNEPRHYELHKEAQLVMADLKHMRKCLKTLLTEPDEPTTHTNSSPGN